MGEKAEAPISVSPMRKFAASGALVGAGGVLAAIAVHDLRWVEWGLLGTAGVVAAAGIGLSRRSIVSQVMSRAVGWLVLAPSAMVFAASSMSRSAIEPVSLVLTASSAAALLLARPMLHTKEAVAQFHPTSYRSWLLTSATTAAAAGISALVVAMATFRWHDTRLLAAGFGLVGASLLGSAFGVARMRAWGVLLAAATALTALFGALFARDGANFALSLTALPGLMMMLPVLFAALSRARAARTGGQVRIAEGATSDVVPTRYRISAPTTDDGAGDVALGLEDDDAEHGTRRSMAHAARIA